MGEPTLRIRMVLSHLVAVAHLLVVLMDALGGLLAVSVAQDGLGTPGEGGGGRGSSGGCLEAAGGGGGEVRTLAS